VFEIDVLGPVAWKKQIEAAIAVVIEPDGGVRVDPRRQTGLLANRREALASVVVKELGAPVLIDE
jgi:hypothetical protein